MTVVGFIPLRRIISLIGVPLALSLLSSATLAKTRKRAHNAEISACVANYKSGLEQANSGRLIEARELFIRCSKNACGSPLRDECTTRFTQLANDIPSIVPVVTDGAGKAVTDVNVQVDGERLTSSIDGHSFILNPGSHDFSFSKEGHVFATESLLIIQGQRNRLVSASLEPVRASSPEEAPHLRKAKHPEAQAAPRVASNADDDSKGKEKADAPKSTALDLPAAGAAKDKPDNVEGADLTARAEPTPTRHVGALSIVTASVGVAALGAGALLTYWGRKDNTLLNACSPACPQSSADHVRNLYLASDVAFGLGVAALAGSYWAYLRSSDHGKDEEEVAVRSAPTIVVAPTRSGAVGALSGRF